MKTKKAVVLIAIILFSLFFNNCTTIFSILYGSTKYYNYEFVNKKNKTVVIRGKRERYSPEITMEGIKFNFGFEHAGRRQIYWDDVADDMQSYGKDIVGGRYYPWIDIRAPEGKFIDHVLINKVVIFAGKTEYSMLERVSHVSLSLINDSLSFTEEENATIRRTGLINRSVYTEDDKDYIFIMRDVFVRFYGVPIDFTKYKEIKMLFDISIEYTTGETITVNQELIGLLKMNRVPRFDYFYFPTV